MGKKFKDIDIKNRTYYIFDERTIAKNLIKTK